MQGYASGVGGLLEMSENSRGDRALAERGLDTLKCSVAGLRTSLQMGYLFPWVCGENDSAGSIAIN